MTLQRAGRLAWSSCATCVALTATGLAFLAVNDGTLHANPLGSPALDAAFGVVFLSFPLVGALIASRQPRNPIGWLFLGTGFALGLQRALLGWSTHELVVGPGTSSAGALAALVADLLWVPTLVGGIAMLFLLFPDGRLPSPRWRAAIWLSAPYTAAYLAGTALKPGSLYYFPATDNPLGVEGAAAVAGMIVDGSGIGALGLVLAAIAALIVRFRRSQGQERQQLKWLAYAAVLLALSTPVQPLLDDLEVAGAVLSDVVFVVLLGLLPIAVGIAILRHRLYDVDLVISRTLVYALLSATLGGSYLGLVLVLGLAVGESDIAVAASTLAVAALFRPARARIQALVDRRFYRRRYDAARTLAAFGGSLRDELDLEALGRELRSVVSETVQPLHVSLWLRSER